MRVFGSRGRQAAQVMTAPAAPLRLPELTVEAILVAASGAERAPKIPAGTPHPSPFLAGKGWVMSIFGVWVRRNGT